MKKGRLTFGPFLDSSGTPENAKFFSLAHQTLDQQSRAPATISMFTPRTHAKDIAYGSGQRSMAPSSCLRLLDTIDHSLIHHYSRCGSTTTKSTGSDATEHRCIGYNAGISHTLGSQPGAWKVLTVGQREHGKKGAGTELTVTPI